MIVTSGDIDGIHIVNKIKLSKGLEGMWLWIFLVIVTLETMDRSYSEQVTCGTVYTEFNSSLVPQVKQSHMHTVPRGPFKTGSRSAGPTAIVRVPRGIPPG